MADEFERAKALIRVKCSELAEKGADFERLTSELLTEFGFFHVRRQGAGLQFGRDLSAKRENPDGGDPTRWFFECKNWAAAVPTSEIAAKLFWHLSRDLLTGGFVIVGPSTLTNDVVELLGRTELPFSVFDWTDDNFVKLVGVCPETRERRFPSVALPSDADTLAEWRSHLLTAERCGYEMATPLRTSLRRHFPRPSQYAYFEKDGHVEWWETEQTFIHHLLLSNIASWPILVTSVRVRTIAYEPLPKRILVQEKPLGIFEPLRLEYAPLPLEDSCVELLGDQMRQVHSRETDALRLELNRGPPGLYDLQVEVMYTGNGKTWTDIGRRLQVCICNDVVNDFAADPGNRLHLSIVLGHYHRAARRVLQLTEDTWRQLNESCPGGASLVWDLRAPSGEAPRWQIAGRGVTLDLGAIPDEAIPRNSVLAFVDDENFYRKCARKPPLGEGSTD